MTPIRAVGLVSLTAIALNGIIGAGIFSLPATVAQILGPAGPLAYVLAAVAISLIALCFAEAGSLFERSGGPYVYAREAFGGFVGFQAGWLFVISRLTALAAVANTFVDYLGFFHPALASGAARVTAITLLLGSLTVINCRGVKQGAAVLNVISVGKLIPLVLFAIGGLFFVDPVRLSVAQAPAFASLQKATLLLMFAFGGFEVATIPSEEVVRPRRTLPLSLMLAVGSTAVLFSLIQVVATGTLDGLAASKTPLASATQAFLGPVGGLLMSLGAVLSTAGNSGSSLLVVPRALYALAQDGQMPGMLGRLHAEYRTPLNAIVVYSVVAWALAISGGFATLATASAIARLLFYLTTCLAIPVLRRKMPGSEGRFRLPGGPMIPVVAAVVCVWLLSGSSRDQALVAAGVIAAGSVIYFGFRARASARDAA